MKPEEFEEQIRKFVVNLYPEISDASVECVSGPSIGYIRRERRRRGTEAPLGVESAPVEHRFVYRSSVQVSPSISIERIVIVVADNAGNVLDIIESK